MAQQDIIGRDISWLSFNARVLQEAGDESVPLYERLKFLAIYSSNLDEFFRVRVSAMRGFKDLKKKTRKKYGLKPKKILKRNLAIIQKQLELFGQTFQSLLDQLASNHIHLINEEKYIPIHKGFVKKQFNEQIQQLLKPILIDLKHPIKEKDDLFLNNHALYLVVQFKEADSLAIVNIPDKELGRFVVLPSEQKEEHYITFIDDMVRCCLPTLFKNKEIAGIYSIKLSRDAELYLGDEFSGDLIKKLKKNLSNRDTGLPTRFLYDHRMPKVVLKQLQKLLKLSKYDLVPGGRYHNFKDFFGLPDPTKNPKLHDTPLEPLPHPALAKQHALIEAVKRKDYILHFPYQKYDYVSKMLQEAADDPSVASIKITLYRVANKSQVATTLLHALSKGKQVTAFIEAKARFDEESNLYWGEKLQQAGAKVIYSYPAIKVHTKLFLIERKEGSNLKKYAYLGTGNFNEKTAKLYCDHAILTAKDQVTNEVKQVFDLLEGKILLPKTKHLFVSPYTSRIGFEKLIDKEIQNAKEGKEAYMILKMNSLEDKGMIQKLYKASQAGVKIQLIVRGICCLVPQVKGLSENIQVRSIIDRFLEHARVYIFCNNGQEKMYLASADWMTRNLDRRIEIVFPVYASDVYQELRKIIDFQLADNTKARIIDTELNNFYFRNEEPQLACQKAIYHYLKST